MREEGEEQPGAPRARILLGPEATLHIPADGGAGQPSGSERGKMTVSGFCLDERKCFAGGNSSPWDAPSSVGDWGLLRPQDPLQTQFALEITVGFFFFFFSRPRDAKTLQQVIRMLFRAGLQTA